MILRAFGLTGVALLAAALASCSGDDTSDLGYCGTGYVDAAAFEGSEPRSRDGDLSLCVVAGPASEERNFTVDLAQVNGHLYIDGSAFASTIVFPQLTEVDALHFMGCAFSAARFPQLAALEALYLSCQPVTTRTDVFEVSTTALNTVETLSMYGQGRISAPLLSHIGVAELMDIVHREAVDSPLLVAPGAEVRELRIAGALDGIRGVNVATVDTLTLEAPIGDLREDAFPNLQRVQTLRIFSPQGLTQCAVDAMLARLSEPPDSIEIDTPLSGCGAP